MDQTRVFPALCESAEQAYRGAMAAAAAIQRFRRLSRLEEISRER